VLRELVSSGRANDTRIVVDDQAFFREGVRAMLTFHGFDFVGEAANG
jgi:DNA-binding NarL/FixJ family response regulator